MGRVLDGVTSDLVQRASALTEAIDAVLPQTQCRQCGHDGCRPYATAIASGLADINQCPPGGDRTIVRIAAVVSRPVRALDPTRGPTKAFALAVIDEAICIGCTLCIQACPVDAIVGGAKRMHDVIPELCTGCELCLAPCPVDCIEMKPAPHAWDDARAAAARIRHDERARRLERLEGEADPKGMTALDAGPADEAPASAPRGSRRQAIVAAAIERARLLRQTASERAAERAAELAAGRDGTR